MVQNRYLQSLSEFGAKAKDAASLTRQKILEEYWPTIMQVWRDRVGPVAVDVARNDEKLTNVARAVYAPLPLAFRLFVSEAEFVNFCLTHRDRLVPRDELSCGGALGVDETTATSDESES